MNMGNDELTGESQCTLGLVKGDAADKDRLIAEYTKNG